MERSRVKRLVAELGAAGLDSVYLDRLRARLDVEEAHDLLEQEIVHEMAAALGRAAEKVDLALLRLEVAGRAVDAAADGAERAAHVRDFNRLRDEALRARHHLLIHREAVGFRRNEDVDRLWPVPPRRR